MRIVNPGAVVNVLLGCIKDIDLKYSIQCAYIDLNSFASPWHQYCKKPTLIYDAPAGAKMHHWWKGGYIQHLDDMRIFGSKLYKDTEEMIRVDFSVEDLVVLILIHDLSKGIAFEWVPENEKKDQYPFRYRKGFWDNMGFDHKTSMLLAHYGIRLTEQQYIAFLHTEGGWSEAAGNKRDGNMLAKFMNILDMYSSQMLGGRFVPDGKMKDKRIRGPK